MLKDQLFRLTSRLHPRTSRVLVNGVWGLLTKGGSVIISFLLVPLTLDYLDTTAYGVWLTLSSVLTFLTLLDVGIGNGLRNQFAEAVTKQNILLARSYLSTAYLLFTGLQIVFLLLFIPLNQYISWQKLLSTSISEDELRIVSVLLFVSVCIKLVLDLITFVLYALQKSALVGIIQLLSNALTLIGVYILTYYDEGNMIKLALITSIAPIIVLIGFSMILFQGHLRVYLPSIKLVNNAHISKLIGLGYKFFFIQIAVLIILYSDNLIITHLFSPADVAPYNAAFRYYSLVTTTFTIIIGPFWSAFTEAQVKNDQDWMFNIYKRLRQLWLGVVAAVVLMIITSQYFYGIWLGDRLNISFMLNLFMGLSVIIICWNNITATIINGLGKIKLQLYLAFLAALINVPLGIYFGSYLGLGSAGVILATCISLLFGSIGGTIQVGKLINKTATGIWAK